MGLLGKFKNMFIEEIEEEDEPIKKEVIQVEIPAPKEKVEEAFEPVTKVETEKKEEKFVFPVYFDDKDFEEIDKKTKTTPVVSPKREAYGVKKEEKVTEKKIFKPTPIISPVYGVLDKNYSKEDITSKKRPVRIDYHNPNDKVDIDDVRKKAYGTLEDDLENNLFEKTSILFNDEIDKQDDDVEPRHQRKEEYDLEENEFEMQDDFVDIASDNMIEDELNKNYEEEVKESSYIDELNDSDLFNLIDSMYERSDK